MSDVEVPPPASLPGPALPPAPTGPSPELPVTIGGWWRRDWSLSNELIGPALVTIRADEIVVTGRRTSLVRGLAYSAFRVALWVSVVAVGLALLLTGCGVGWRWGAWSALFFLCFGFPIAISSGVLLRYVVRRIVEPPVRLRFSWGQVRSIASDGEHLELVADMGGVPYRGRVRAKKPSASVRKLLAAVRDGRLREASSAPLGGGRPLWVDRLVVAGALGLSVVCGVRFEPAVSAWLMRPDGSGVGVPAALAPAQLEELRAARCTAAPTGAPAPALSRDGPALRWSLTPPSTDFVPVLVRWPAGSSRVELLGSLNGASGTVPTGLGSESSVAALLVVPSAHLDTALQLLALGTRDALYEAHCAGLISRLDLTVTAPTLTATAAAVRDGDDLRVMLPELGFPATLLAVRWRPGAEGELYDWCEIPMRDGVVETVPATPSVRFPHFFVSNDDEARVYVLPQQASPALERLARGGPVQRCYAVDSVRWTGASYGFAVTRTKGRDETVGDVRRQVERATRLALGDPRWERDATVLDDLTTAFGAALQAGQGANHDQVMQGFLDGVPYTAVFDQLAFSSLPQFEQLRQSVDGLDPEGVAGRELLMRLAGEFMRRVPVHFAYGRRIEVAEAWLGVTASSRFQWAGKDLRVPSDAVDTYQMIGRYLLMDVSRRIEADVAAGRHDLGMSFASILPVVRLQLLGFEPQFPPSTRHKLLQAWVSGDFGYILDRVLKKTQEKLISQDATVLALGRSTWLLDASRSDAAGTTRTSTLRRDGRDIGWIAQFDGRRVRVGFGVGRVAGRGALPGVPLLATAASYMTGDQRTSGLAVVRGEVVNYTIDPKIGGLVVVGGPEPIAILDLRGGGVLPGDGRLIRPLADVSDFQHLVRWLKRNRASAFQTHVLYADGVPRVDRDKAAPDPRERRLLVDARYRGNPIVVVVDLPSAIGGWSLYEAMTIAVAALSAKDPGLEVVGIANLDVGSYNVLHAWDEGGKPVRQTAQPLSDALNVLTVSR